MNLTTTCFTSEIQDFFPLVNKKILDSKSKEPIHVSFEKHNFPGPSYDTHHV